MTSMFEVDAEGLKKILSRKGIEFAILELIQNAFDEDVSNVSVKLLRVPKTPYVEIEVIDDSPTGFADLTHAFTLFAESKKKANPEQRGRFNLGEKLVIAACRWARIATTTGTVEFSHGERKRLRSVRMIGSAFTGQIRMTNEELARAEAAVRTVLVPAEIRVTFNGEKVDWRRPRHCFKSTLPTEVADGEGYLRPTKRKTTVRLIDVKPGESPTLYELGIPVVQLEGDAFHVDIGQKVPLNVDRDNVTPAYLRKVRTDVLNHLAAEDDLDGDTAAAPWVSEAMESPDASEDAIKAVIRERYGDKVVIADPSDREAQSIAAAKGYAVIQPRSFSKAAHESIRRTGAALPAGRVTPSPKPFSEDGRPLKTISREQWTPAMVARRNFIAGLAQRLIGTAASVSYTKDRQWGFAGAFGSCHMTINLSRMGKGWIDLSHGDPQVMDFVIHELAHHIEGNHLSERYHKALTRLGAKAVEVALKEPGLFLGE